MAEFAKKTDVSQDFLQADQIRRFNQRIEHTGRKHYRRSLPNGLERGDRGLEHRLDDWLFRLK